MSAHTFGLDIGTTSIKVAWLNRQGNTFVYKSVLAVATPAQGIQSESSFDQQEIAKVINKLVIDAKISTNNVNVSLPESHVFTKVIEMPALSEKELSNAIYWEAEQYIPAPLETISLDWTILRKPSAPGQKMHVLLVGAPTDLVKKYQAILGMAGLTVVSVETEMLAVIRSVVGNNNFPTSLLINIGATSTSLAIIKNGIIVFNYSIPLGGIAMTRAIAADFGFSPEQAEEYKRTYGLSDKNFGGKVGAALQPILTAMLAEVKKAITFYNERYKNESPISQTLLLGGGANLPGIVVYFAQNIGTETSVGNPWKLLNVRGVPKEVEARGPGFTVAIGLALKEYELRH
jgi:type IV pilus assembly protein PilM